MKKIILFITIFLISIGVVNAKSNIPSGVEETINNYIKSINNQDLNATKYIDEANMEVIKETKNKINGLDLKYEIKDIKDNNDNTYTVSGTISAKGTNFEINGFSVDFTVKQDENGSFIITSTDLFEILDVDNIIKFVIKVVAIIFGILFVIAIISAIIIGICVKKNKQRLEQKS